MPTKLRKPALNLADLLMYLLIAGIFLTHILTQLAAAIGLIFLVFRFRRLQFNSHHPLTILSLLLGAMAVISLWFPVVQPASAPAILPYLILLSVLPHLEQRGKLSLPEIVSRARWIVILAAAAALTGVIRHFEPLDRTKGLYGGYFTLAVSITFAIPLTLGWYRRLQARFRYLLLVLLAVEMAALWWTYTRTAFMALFIGMVIWIFREIWAARRTGNRFSRSFLSLLVAVPLSLIILTATSSDHRINPLAPIPASELASDAADLSSGRSGIIADAGKILHGDFSQKKYLALLAGHGIRSRSRLVKSKFKSWESDYLQSFMDLGTTGLVLILLIYFSFFRQLFLVSRMEAPFYRSLVVAGISFWLMSFLTLQLTSITGAAIFCVVIGLLPDTSTR